MRWKTAKGTIELTFPGPPEKDSPPVSRLIQNGLTHHQAGRLHKAEIIYQSILKKHPQHPDVLHLLGVIAHQVGKDEIAVNLIENAIRINPAVPDFYNNCGEAYRSLHKHERAIGQYEQALAIKPDYATAYYNLGNALKDIGRQEEAVTRYERALFIMPAYAAAHNNLGVALQELGRLEDARAHYERAITIKPDYAEALNNLGSTFKELDRMEDAIIRYERALAIKPDYAEAHNNLGVSFQFLGKLKDAITCYERALAIKPDYAEAHRHLALIHPKKEQISIIEKRLASPTVSEKDSIHYYNALGYIYDQTHDYTKAFEQHLKANTLKRKVTAYDPQNHSDFVDRLIKVYSKKYFQKKTSFGSNAQLPIFIVGMPRSGTTLVEQIVSSHPLVHGAGELTSFGRIEEAITNQFEASNTYPECMSLCDEFSALKLSAEYLEALSGHAQNVKHITDKMPSNFLRIGLIKTLFPHVRIVHCRRNALDTCTSIFLNYFATGNEYSFDLTDIGRYYLDYQRLMVHWHSLFSSEILDVQYEELVMNQEKIIRQLIEYLGLEWDERCLNFHRNTRAVNTASNLQVRKPLYKSSIDRWKQYEKYLDPLIAILQPNI